MRYFSSLEDTQVVLFLENTRTPPLFGKEGQGRFGNIKSFMKQPQSAWRKLNIVQEIKRKRQLREKRVLQVLL